MHVYHRRAIRLMGLIPIFMGTNLNLANFIDIDSAYDFRIEICDEEKDIPWCFLGQKLSATSSEYVENKKKECESIAIEKKAFIEMILIKERPLFVTLIRNFKNNKEKDEIQIIKVISRDIMNEYRSRKRYMINFKTNEECRTYNFCNLLLITPEFWVRI